MGINLHVRLPRNIKQNIMRSTEGKKQNMTAEVYGQGRRMYAVLSVLFFLSGIFGILMAVGTIEGVEYQRQLVFSSAAILCVVLWLLACFARPVLPWTLDIVVIAAGYFILTDIVNIAEEIRSIGYNASNMHEEALNHAEDVTKSVLLLTIALIVLLFAFEFVLETHVISVIVATAVLVMAPILGVKLSLLNLLLFAIFLFGLMAMLITGRGRGRSLTEERRIGLSGYIGFIEVLIVVLIFLIAVPLTKQFREQLYEFVFQAEENVSSMTRNINRHFRTIRNSGYINRGNNYINDEPVIHLDFNKLPEDAVYLKTFSGDNYDSRQWTASDEMAFYHNVATAIADGNMSEEEAAATAWTAYFMMNRIMSGFDDNNYELRIKHLRKGETGAFRPYFALDMDRPEGTDECYTVSEMQRLVLAGTLPPSPSADELAALEMYRDVNAVSFEMAKAMYTSVSAPLPRLREFVSENPFTSVEEITAFIIYTLHSTCKYTTTPGHAPMNADIAEYFLFESKRGYCQQFASAAVLMYRLYGIPARYATGYRVRLHDVKLNEGGGFGMDVSDAFSHAWPEIFLDGYGWTPIEVTPGENGEVMAQFPGVSTETLMSVMDEHGWRLAVKDDGIDGQGGTDEDPDSAMRQAEDESETSEEGSLEDNPDLIGMELGDIGLDESDMETSLSAEDATGAGEGEGDISRGAHDELSRPDGNDSEGASDGSESESGSHDGSTDGKDSRWKELIDKVLSVLWIVFKVLLWVSTVAVAFAAAAFGVSRYRRYRLRKLRDMDAKKCGEIYMRLLHYCGLLIGYEGVEPDFAEKLEEAVEGLEAECAGSWTTEMSRQLAAAAFGPEQNQDGAMAGNEVGSDRGGVTASGGSAAGQDVKPNVRKDIKSYARQDVATDTEDKAQDGLHADKNSSVPRPGSGRSDHAAEGMRAIYFYTLKKLYKKAAWYKKPWLWLYFGA